MATISNLLDEFLALETKRYFQEELPVKWSTSDAELSKYIDKLQSIIKKQRKVLKNICQRIRNYQKSFSVNHVSTQTEDATEQKKASVDSWSKKNTSIEEMVKEVAEDAMKQTGFVYEATSGLYYDFNTGYYYNAELGLYYDGNSGTYYYYDKENNQFVFHSQVAVPQATSTEQSSDSSIPKNQKKRKGTKSEETKTRKKVKQKEDYEEGECSDESVDHSNNGSDQDDCDTNNSPYNDIAGQGESLIAWNDPKMDDFSKAWPPCMRIIVKETSVKNFKVGKLFIVTCAGGTLGREGDHSILIPDISISKYHAKFVFDNINNEKEIGNYTLTDLGSRNGTFVDGVRLSTALQESEPHVIPHNSIVRVGSTTLLCHIHTGRDTCQDCEPGLLIEEDEKQKAYVAEGNLTEKRKKQLKKLKQKFGLNNQEHIPVTSSDYTDRAEIRRQTVGSYSENYKVETASVTEPIKNTNKGFKMLAKMGWTEGESLGSKSEDAIKEPVLVEQRREKVGLGYEGPTDAELPEVVKRKQELWKKVQDRYKNLEDK